MKIVCAKMGKNQKKNQKREGAYHIVDMPFCCGKDFWGQEEIAYERIGDIDPAGKAGGY